MLYGAWPRLYIDKGLSFEHAARNETMVLPWRSGWGTWSHWVLVVPWGFVHVSVGCRAAGMLVFAKWRELQRLSKHTSVCQLGAYCCLCAGSLSGCPLNGVSCAEREENWPLRSERQQRLVPLPSPVLWKCYKKTLLPCLKTYKPVVSAAAFQCSSYSCRFVRVHVGLWLSVLEWGYSAVPISSGPDKVDGVIYWLTFKDIPFQINLPDILEFLIRS